MPSRSWDRCCSNWARSSISEMTVMRIHTGIARRNRRLLVWVVPMLSLGVVGPGATAEQGNTSYQERHAKGQNIAPAYEGWEANPDGTFNLVFGYMNRNWEEQPDIPVGPDNSIEPGGPDQGQPTHFLPRRNQFVFRVRVPKDFGKKELVWTLTVNGRTEKAYGTLHPDYILEDSILHRNYTNTSPPKMHENKRPMVTLEGENRRTVRVGEPLDLAAVVRDDGLLAPRAARGREGYNPALGLRVAWFVYRGPAAQVTFEPEQFKVYPDTKGNSPWAPGWLPPPVPGDGRFPVKVVFKAPGTFVLQVLAHDGGLAASQDVTVNVVPSSAPSVATTTNGPKAAGPKLQTPWGHPDLQGVWTNHHGVPLERPGNLAAKSELTSQDIAALETAVAANRDR